MLRVLHEFNGPDLVDGAVAAAASLRNEPGCQTAEVYATLADEHHWALTMVWESEAAYWDLWGRVVAGELPALKSVTDSGETEFYAQAAFAIVDGRWVPQDADESRRRIFWPARGAVRIIIQNAYADNPRMHELTRAEIAETRREPGCVAYAWMENVEVPGHLMLLEVWSDQFVYDHHWFGRTKTAALRGDSGRAATEPRRGPAVREFYRQQCFDHQYGRWLPAEVEDYSETIGWPAS